MLHECPSCKRPVKECGMLHWVYTSLTNYQKVMACGDCKEKIILNRNKILRQRTGNKNPFFNKTHSKENKKKFSDLRSGKGNPMYGRASEHFKNLWADKKFRERTIKAQLKGLFKRPTSLEKQFIEFIQKHNLPYKYTGDGSFLIGYKNPDFINVNGEKTCVEVANHFHHQGDWKQKRIEHFAKFGWKCIVIFSDRTEDRKNWIFDEQKILQELNKEAV